MLKICASFVIYCTHPIQRPLTKHLFSSTFATQLGVNPCLLKHVNTVCSLLHAGRDIIRASDGLGCQRSAAYDKRRAHAPPQVEQLHPCKAQLRVQQHPRKAHQGPSSHLSFSQVSATTSSSIRVRYERQTMRRLGNPAHGLGIARKSGAGMHQKRWQRIWRHCMRLPGRTDDRCALPQVGPNSCISRRHRKLTHLFVSLRYHRLHPEYIHQRIEKLGTAFNLRILLILCDVVSNSTSHVNLGPERRWLV